MCLHGAFRGSVECLDTAVLFDPLEEKVDPPATFVRVADRQSWQRRQIGQEHEGFPVFWDRGNELAVDAPGILASCSAHPERLSDPR